MIYSNSSGSFTVNFEADKNSSRRPSGLSVESDQWNLIGSFSQRPIMNFGPLFGSASESGITLKRYGEDGFSDAERITPRDVFWAIPVVDTIYRPE